MDIRFEPSTVQYPCGRELGWEQDTGRLFLTGNVEYHTNEDNKMQRVNHVQDVVI